MRRVTALLSSCIACSLFLTEPAAAQEVFSCVWRNPERTMTRIFPAARDYKTVTLPIGAAQRQAIERAMGFPLLPGQREQFQYYVMTGGDGRPLGSIIAASQKGEYGAIEFVFGLDPAGAVAGIYVQRSRERDQSFKERAFLDPLVGLELGDADRLRRRQAGEKNRGHVAVLRGLLKELVTFRELTRRRAG